MFILVLPQTKFRFCGLRAPAKDEASYLVLMAGFCMAVLPFVPTSPMSAVLLASVDRESFFNSHRPSINLYLLNNHLQNH
jgi:hypothetical protein